MNILSTFIKLFSYRKIQTKVGLQLRQAMFVNGIIFNSEVWNSTSKEDIKKLEAIDHQITRVVCDSHAKTAIEYLYLETGEKPLRHIIPTADCYTYTAS